MKVKGVRNEKRFLSMILSVLLIAVLAIPASASEETSGVPVETPDGTTDSGLVDEGVLELEEEDLIISEEVAGYVAEFFVRDMIETGQTSWDDSTTVVDTVVMYDEMGTAVTGYTFGLTSGYVVVSAYLDIPSLILEWSDIGEPVYENAEMNSEDQVVYLGALDYYIDSGEETLETVDGEAVSRSEVSNDFEEQRSLENLDENVVSAIMEVKENANALPGISLFASDDTKGGYITDPIKYAKNVYSGSWWSNNYSNPWSAYTWPISVMSDFPGYEQNCGPTAITNMIRFFGLKSGHSRIMEKGTMKEIYDEVINANDDYYINKSNGGTFTEKANGFIRDSFNNFGLSVRTFGLYDVNYQNTVNALGSTNRLMYINLTKKTSHPYGDHAVVGYAYTRLMNSKGDGRAFIKIADGHSSDGRYVEIDSIAPGATYWEVNFSKTITW